jgi:catechol 2,3-dioxygenase-like lactoylglutathione lyase family enzyme
VGHYIFAVSAIPVSGVSELVLEVVDLDAAERFYAGVLGFPVVERWSEREAVWVMAGARTRIGLWKPQVGIAGGRGGVHVHYAMQLDERHLDEAIARLREHGCEVEEHDFSGYGRGRGRAAYVADPDGNVVELWTWDVGEHLDEPAP